MPRLRPTVVLLSLLALSTGAGLSAHSAYAGTPHGSGRIVLAAGGISLNQAISMVERRFRARVVRSDVRQEGDRKIYVLRLLDDSGNAQVVRVDAQTGQIM
jgi:uncharacterized membrane protein YkoI